jgi:hypothetical protein
MSAKALSVAELERLSEARTEVVASVAVYQAAHPELAALVSGFIQAAAEARVPAVDLVQFATQHFAAQ